MRKKGKKIGAAVQKKRGIKGSDPKKKRRKAGGNPVHLGIIIIRLKTIPTSFVIRPFRSW